MEHIYTELPPIDGHQVQQADSTTTSQDFTLISCSDSARAIHLSIFYDYEDRNSETAMPPYYSLTWDSNFNRDQVVDVFRRIGEAATNVEFMCKGNDDIESYWPEDYEAGSEEDKAAKEAAGISPNLDLILRTNFDLLRLESDEVTLVWHPDFVDLGDEQTYGFGIIHDSLPDNPMYVELVKNTINPEFQPDVERTLRVFNDVFKYYAYAEKIV